MFGFFPLNFFYQKKKEQERKIQKANEPDTWVQIRRDQGDENQAVTAGTVTLWLAPGLSPGIFGERQEALEGETKVRRWLSPDQQQYQSSGGHPGQSTELKIFEVPMLGVRQREEVERDGTEGCEFHQSPSLGPWGSR